MGATITTGKAVMACQPNAQSEVIYILFEQTYEKNCYPHTPNWGCFAIGTYKQVMKRVYARASSAEGGSLNNRSMDLTPESYLRGWNLAFHKPMLFNDTNISFRILERDRWRDGIESDKAGLLFQKLKEINRLSVWHDLISEGDDSISSNFYSEIDLILAIFGVDGIEPPWKIIASYFEPRGVEVPGFIPAKAHGGWLPSGIGRLIKFKSNIAHAVFAKQSEDGRYYGYQWEYSIIADFVREQAYQCEMVQHGLGVKNIKSFRDLLDSLPFSNDDYDIYIKKSAISHYNQSNYAEMLGCQFEDVPDMYLAGQSLNEAEKKFYSYNGAFVFIPKQQAKLAA